MSPVIILLCHVEAVLSRIGIYGQESILSEIKICYGGQISCLANTNGYESTICLLEEIRKQEKELK